MYNYHCTACNDLTSTEHRLPFCPCCGMEALVEIDRADLDAARAAPLPLDPMEAEMLAMEQGAYEARMSHHHANW